MINRVSECKLDPFNSPYGKDPSEGETRHDLIEEVYPVKPTEISQSPMLCGTPDLNQTKDQKKKRKDK